MSDFSLVKMVYKIAKEHRREPRWPEIEQAIRRNFGGLDEIDPVKIFRKFFPFSRNDKVGVLKKIGLFYICLRSFHHISQLGGWCTQVLQG